MDLSRFYKEKDRLSYNPRENLSVKRGGIKRLVSFDDRFVTVSTKINKLIEGFNKFPIKVLDVGVGDAVYESLINKDVLKKLEIYGIDISSAQLLRAKKYLKEARLVDLNKQSIPYQGNFFNIVIASEILEHVFYPEKVLSEVVRVLKPKGFLVLTYPNSGSLQLRLSLLLTGRSPLLNYPENKEHIRFFSKKDILKMLDGSARLTYFQGLGSFLFGRWNSPVKIITPRFLQILGNRLLPNFALGNLMIFQK